MQRVSEEYKEAMKKRLRNRAYIEVTIGVVNREAQKNIQSDESNDLVYFSDNPNGIFKGETVTREYATCEQNFTKIDGSMYFPYDEGRTQYFQGIVTSEIMGSIKISFNGATDLDIKGLTIDFSDHYPTAFTIENDEGVRSYGNNQRVFTTEDTFNGTSYFIITPISFLGGDKRLRVYSFSCGLTNRFTNSELISYSEKQYVSPITESIPSNDVTITVDNKDLYYLPDDPNSTMAYMEVGQNVDVRFGYDIDDNGTIEWLDPTPTYLKSWSADEDRATFTTTDRFDTMSDTYYRGLYREEGITLYALAEDVFKDAGVEEYYIDPYLNDITVNNPIPPTTHVSALQIIANAARCTLYEDSNKVIHIAANFVPEMTASSPDETAYSHAENVLTNTVRNYAEASFNYSLIDGSMYFGYEDNDKFTDTGYISGQVADARGGFNVPFPRLIIEQEAIYAPNNFKIEFGKNKTARGMHITFYQGSERVAQWGNIIITENSWSYDYELPAFDRMEIQFYLGMPNSRVFVNRVSFGVGANYDLTRKLDLTSTVKATRQQRIQSVDIIRNIYSKNDVSRELATESITVDTENNTRTVYFANPSYNYSIYCAIDEESKLVDETMLTKASSGRDNLNGYLIGYTYIQSQFYPDEFYVVCTTDNATISIIDVTHTLVWLQFNCDEDTDNIGYIVYGVKKAKAEIEDFSDYFVKVKFKEKNGVNIRYSIIGSEYDVEQKTYSKKYHASGDVKEWNNPLISDEEHAAVVEKWLADYFLGEIEYTFDWRGDPRTEANDLFSLETPIGESTIRAVSSTLTFSNAGFKGNMQGRKVYGINELDNT